MDREGAGDAGRGMRTTAGFQERYPVRKEFAEAMEDASRDLYGSLSDEGRRRLDDLLERVFQHEAESERLARQRVEALGRLRCALKEHLRMLEAVKARLESHREATGLVRRRFSVDDLPPN